MSDDDRAEITDLLHHYCWPVDSREPDRLLSEFYASDAVDDHGVGRLEGPEQIRGFLQQMMELTEGLMHVLTNIRIELDGNTASARSYVTGWQGLASESHKGETGRPTTSALGSTLTSCGVIRRDGA
jgi:hypothetical protein